MRVLIFDSGAGGLPVLFALRARFPRADFTYVSDRAHLPYGTRTDEEILSLAAMRIEEAGGIDLAVLACNTVTAVAARALRTRFSFPVFGVEPAVKPALATGRPVTVICTPATARAKRWSAEPLEIATPGGLAAEIECALSSADPTRELETLANRVACGARSDVVLGCTHYVFLTKALTKKGFVVYDGCAGLIRNVARAMRDEGEGRLSFSDEKDARLYLRMIDNRIPVVYTGEE